MTYEEDRVIEFIIESNKIEGVESEEATADSLKAWEYIKDKEKLNFLDSLEVHRLVLERVSPSLAGRFRKADVSIGGQRKKFVSETYFIHRLTHLLRLMQQVPEEKSKRSEFAKDCHVVFEDIHPHEDGNGRTGRLLWLWHRQKMGLSMRTIKADWPKENGQQARYYKWFK